MKLSNQITLSIKIEKGRFASNLPMVEKILEAHEGHTIDVTFKRRRNKRSNNQNRYYFGVIIPIIQNCIMEEWGEIKSKEETHEFLKHNCLFDEVVNEETGQVIHKVKSTSENDTVQQEFYHEKCRQLANDFFNTTIPLPNEGEEIDFNSDR